MTGQQTEGNALLVGSAFALGIVAGLLLRDVAASIYDRARQGQWHRAYKGTVTYGQNLPDQLKRREPAPHPDQPRYGGTGALGVSPEQGM